MNKFKQSFEKLRNRIDLRSLIVFLISATITYIIFHWLFGGSNQPKHLSTLPMSAIKINETSSIPTQKETHEVFNIKEPMSEYPTANSLCQKYHARLATKAELKQAQKDGANWCNLGWIQNGSAYYPTQQTQVDLYDQWPTEFKGGCGNVGLNGGYYPKHLKLSVNCYGLKPSKKHEINAWNTISNLWSKYDK